MKHPTRMAESLLFHSGDVNIRMYAEEGDPASHTHKRPAILLLHGSGGHVDFWIARLGPLLAEVGIALYAPHYFDRTRTVRADLALLTDGIHVPLWLSTVDDALRFVAARPSVDPEHVVLAGISLGAFLALALAAQLSGADVSDARRVRAVLDVSGGLAPPYDAMATPLFPPTLIVHGATDTIVPVTFAQMLDTRLGELGVPHRTEILAGEGHWFSNAVLPRLFSVVSDFLEPILAETQTPVQM